MKLNVLALTLACGITWALAVLMLAYLPLLGWDAPADIVAGIGKLYIGYESTWTGGLIGAAWGFVDAAIGGLIFVLIYNGIAKEK